MRISSQSDVFLLAHALCMCISYLLFSFISLPQPKTQGGEKDTFEELRAIELKHGRVAMLGVVGTFSLCMFVAVSVEN